MKDYLIALAAYNTWANSKMRYFVEAAGEDRTLMSLQSSFSTIRQTILHMMDAQLIWLNRLNGISLQEWPGLKFTGTTVDACVRLVDSSSELEAFTGQLTELHCTGVVSYQNLKGVAFQNTVAEVLAHVMNHSTFHRGQLVAMLRGTGFTDLTSTDMITYFREAKK